MRVHRQVDILVNNAGHTAPMAIQQIDFADFERTMAVNLYAPFTIVQSLLHRGNTFDVIVNIASTAGINAPLRLAHVLGVEGRHDQHERGHEGRARDLRHPGRVHLARSMRDRSAPYARAGRGPDHDHAAGARGRRDRDARPRTSAASSTARTSSSGCEPGAASSAAESPQIGRSSPPPPVGSGNTESIDCVRG